MHLPHGLPVFPETFRICPLQRFPAGFPPGTLAEVAVEEAQQVQKETSKALSREALSYSLSG